MVVDKYLCKCDNPECGMELTLLPHGLGNCPKCGTGRFRIVHPMAYETAERPIFSESAISREAAKMVAELETVLFAEAEMDKYGENES